MGCRRLHCVRGTYLERTRLQVDDGLVHKSPIRIWLFRAVFHRVFAVSAMGRSSRPRWRIKQEADRHCARRSAAPAAPNQDRPGGESRLEAPELGSRGRRSRFDLPADRYGQRFFLGQAFPRADLAYFPLLALAARHGTGDD